MNTALFEDLAGLSVLASIAPGEISGRQFPDDIINLSMPKLFAVAEDEVNAKVSLYMPILYEESQEPKTFKIFPGKAHGTGLFDTEYGDEFRELLLDFLESVERYAH